MGQSLASGWDCQLPTRQSPDVMNPMEVSWKGRLDPEEEWEELRELELDEFGEGPGGIEEVKLEFQEVSESSKEPGC